MYKELISHIAEYKYGFVGYNIENGYAEKFLNAAIPNKFFDYMAAGIPVLVYNCDSIAKIVMKHKIGLVLGGIESVNEFIRTWESHYADFKENVLKIRDQFSMESHIYELINLYDSILKERK